MPRVQLLYSVPVYVEVDTDTETVCRVVIGDESLQRIAGHDVIQDATLTAASPEESAAAFAIAESGTEWPSWQSGY